MDNELLKDTVLKLKDRIIKTEAGNIQLSETDTRQGLINPLFRALQWDFGDFESIKALFMTVWCPDSRSVGSNCGIPRG